MRTHDTFIGIFIVDSSAYTRSLLVERMTRIEGCFLQAHDNLGLLETESQPGSSGILLLNHHTLDTPPFEFLARLKRTSPSTYVMVIVSPGVEKRSLDPLRQAGHIHALIEKPIDPDALAKQVEEEVERQSQSRRLNSEHLDLLRFLPTGGLRRIFKQPEPGHAELFDMTVMFTDIRDSSRHIAHSSAQAYFSRLNRILGEQARLIRVYDGMVVKTTGDGLLAVFEGAARCHLALKCAHAIQALPRVDAIEIGIGISDGLVLTGILGTHEHVHFDVISAHVHMASRLCSLAQGGEILATQDTATRAHFDFVTTPVTESIQVRGFAAPVACAHIRTQPQEPS
jgi:adenylate cyclase